MTIETERLEIIPLTPHLLQLWVEDLPALEAELDCSCQGDLPKGDFLEIIKEQLAITLQNPDDYQWHSFWLLLLKHNRIAVGSLDFKDIPNQDGEVEIGYGLGENYHHKGYMTEAVEAMRDWAMHQKNVQHVVAETELDSFASQNVLLRCGFTEQKRDATIWWKF